MSIDVDHTVSLANNAGRQRATALALAPGIVAFVVLGLVFGLLVGWLIGVLIALIAAAALTWAVMSKAESIVLSRTGARPVEADAHAQLHNLVEGLCLSLGVQRPRLYVVDDPAPNALVTGLRPHDAALVVTRGLLDKLNRVELEGVLARELSLVKTDDVALATMAALYAKVLGPRIVTSLVAAYRDQEADLAGVGYTRYPPALCAALVKIRDDETVARHTDRSIDHLWLVQPAGDAEPAISTHPPLDERIEILREL